MADAILPAIFGLIGTLIGAGVSGGTTYLVAARREKIERERESRNRVIEIKRAARLIDADLIRAFAIAQSCLKSKQWWSPEMKQPSTEAWTQHRGIIAPELSEVEWIDVCSAIAAVDNLNGAYGIIREGAKDLNVPVSETIEANIQLITGVLEDIEAGRGALAPLRN